MKALMHSTVSIWISFGSNDISLRIIKLISAAVKAVNPFYKRIRTKELQDAYFEDYLNIVVRKGFALEDVHANRNTCAIYAPYKLLIVYAKRT